MKFISINEKKRATFLFAGFYLTSILLLILVLTVFWNSSSDGAYGSKKNLRRSLETQYTQVEKVLHEHLTNLEQLDRKYSSLLADSGIRVNFDIVTDQIHQSELALRHALDSIDKASALARNTEKVNELTYTYLSVLDNRRYTDNLQNALALGSKQLNNDQDSLMKLKTYLSDRDRKIADIENPTQLQQSEKLSFTSPKSDSRLLKVEKNYLESELKILEKKYEALQDANNKLKNDKNALISERLNETGKVISLPGADHSSINSK